MALASRLMIWEWDRLLLPCCLIAVQSCNFLPPHLRI